MKMRGLSFDNIPDVYVPFRFFYTAPWMGVLAGLALFASAWQGSGIIANWSPSLLAVTHLVTLGFMVMVMLGAIFQVLPVVSGSAIPLTSVVAPVVHVSLFLGVPVMAAGFFFEKYQLFWVAMPVLSLGFLVFLLALGSLLVKNIRGGSSVFAIRLAGLSLLVAVILGLLRMASYLGYPLFSELPDQRVMHFSWALLGWVFLLVMGVSFQVIPMFHVTPEYSRKFAFLLPATVFVLLLLLSFVRLLNLHVILVVLLFGAVNAYAVYSLFLLARRKRKITDITVIFWRMSLVSLMVASGLFLAGYFLPNHVVGLVTRDGLFLLAGITFIYGFACSVIMGMMQKIIPFLLYLHMQKQCRGDIARLVTLPDMHRIVPIERSMWQLRLHGAALSLLLLSVAGGLTQLLYFSALAMLIDFAWLGVTVTGAVTLYSDTAKRLDRDTQS